MVDLALNCFPRTNVFSPNNQLPGRISRTQDRAFQHCHALEVKINSGRDMTVAMTMICSELLVFPGGFPRRIHYLPLSSPKWFQGGIQRNKAGCKVSAMANSFILSKPCHGKVSLCGLSDAPYPSFPPGVYRKRPTLPKRENEDGNSCHAVVNFGISSAGLTHRMIGSPTPVVKLSVGPDSLDDSLDEENGNEVNVQTASEALAQWRNARTRADQQIVDWGRYHLQIMFVDRTHTIRARLAEGLFGRIASWNGVGLSLYPHSCGISAKEGEVPSMVLQAEAHRLGLGGYVFSAPSTSFDRSDLDMYDLIVAVDINVRDDILLIAAQQPSIILLNYEQKVRLLGEFVSYGVMTMLEDDLREKVQPDLIEAKSTLEINPTYMSQYSAWRSMLAAITLSSAGLVRFLMDAYPDNLPDYDPVD